jgi:hypothetical protein
MRDLFILNAAVVIIAASAGRASKQPVEREDSGLVNF